MSKPTDIADETTRRLLNEKCRRLAYPSECHNDAKPPHKCPYKEDVNNDSETLCNCCDSCMKECSDDI